MIGTSALTEIESNDESKEIPRSVPKGGDHPREGGATDCRANHASVQSPHSSGMAGRPQAAECAALSGLGFTGTGNKVEGFGIECLTIGTCAYRMSYQLGKGRYSWRPRRNRN